MHATAKVFAAAAVILSAACAGPQSALMPAGRGAERIATLFWWMAAGAVVIWLIVFALGAYSTTRRGPHDERRARMLIIGGGALVPTVVLAGLLAYGLAMMPDLIREAPPGSMVIHVTGEQFWWRVRYPHAGGAVELANEIRLPAGRAVEFRVDSPDVIHAFWIPSLGGKIDMVPGRVNRLLLEPTRVGTYRGTCTEFCGMSHALMSFPVAVVEEREFEQWLEQQARPAQAPAEPIAARGATLFNAHGCNACHTIRGTAARGVIGPDLTHVGGRMSLGAGILPNDVDAFVRWIVETEKIKPGVHMPQFAMLPRHDVRAIAAYLDGLE